MSMHTVTVNGEDFEVLFDGSHQNCDADLLADESSRILEKRQGTSRPPIESTHTAAIAVLAVLEAAPSPMTRREIAEAAQMTVGHVSNGLYYLQLDGRLCSQEVVSRMLGRGQKGWGGQGRQKEYWITA